MSKKSGNKQSKIKSDKSIREKAEEIISGKPSAVPDVPDGDPEKLIHELQVHQVELQMQNEELHRTQAELQDARDKYSELYDFAPVPYFTLDTEGCIIDINLTGTRLLGVEKSLLLNRSLDTFVANDMKNRFVEHLRLAAKTGQRQLCELRLLRSGGPLDVEMISIAANESNGRERLILSSVVDITERKIGELSLKENQRWLDLAYDSAEFSPWDWNIATGDVTFTERETAILGYSTEEVREKFNDWEGMIYPRDRQKAISAMDDFRSGASDFLNLEYRLKCKNGDYKWVLSQGKIIAWDDQGKPVRAMGVHQDISRRKEREERQALEKHRLQAGLKSLFFGLLDYDIVSGKLFLLGFAEDLGYLEGETEYDYKFLMDKAHPEDKPRLSKMLKHALKGEIPAEFTEFDFRLQDAAGHWRWIFAHGNVVIKDEDGKPSRFLVDLIDVTGRKHAEENIQRKNEELAQQNEELRITEEELQLQNEELQSAEEELQTQNEEIRDAYERLQTAQEALFESEERFRSLFEHMVNGFVLYEILYDENGRARDARYLDVNPAFEKLLGIKREDVIGRTLTKIFPKLAREHIKDYETVAGGGGPITSIRGRYDTGQRFKASMYSPKPGHVAVIFEDITERLRLENLQRQYRERMELALKGGDLGMWEWNLLTNEAIVDARWSEITGYALDEIQPIHIQFFEKILFHDDIEKVNKAIEDHLNGLTERYDAEFRVVTKDGQIRWLHSMAKITERMPDGSPGRIVGTFIDITERKQAEEAVKAERQRLYDVLETLPAYVAILSPDYRVPFANRFFRERFGESHGKRCYEFLFDRDKPCEDCETYKVMDTKAPHNWEWTGPDGHTYEVHDFPFYEPDGSMSILEMGLDVTEQRSAEKALRGSEERFRSLFNTMITAYAHLEMIYDEAGKPVDSRFLEVNPAWEKMMGLSRDQAVGMTLTEVFPGIEPYWNETYAKVVETGEPVQFENYLGAVDKYYRVMAFRPAPGQYAVNFIDITERKKAEAAIRDLARFPEENPNPVIRVSNDNEILYGNSASAGLLESWQTKVGERLPDDVFARIKEESSISATRDLELECGGRSFWSRVTHVADRGYISIYSKDITEHKKAEQALRESEEHYRALFDTMLTAYAVHEMIFDENGIPVDARFLDVNPAWEQMMGLSREQAIGKRIYELWPQLEPYWVEIYGRVVTTGEPAFFENYFAATDKYFQVMAYRPAPGRYAINFLDITERKRAEEALRENEERLRVALASADILVFNTDKDLRYTWMYNPQIGFTVEEVLGKRDDELLPPQDARQLIAVKQKVIDSGIGTHEEVVVIKDGKKHVYDIVVEPLKDKSGELIGLTAATFEITGRKEIEESLWRVNELLETMFFSIDFHLAYLDRDMNFIRVNRAYAAGNGHLPEYFTGKNHFELYPHEENEKIFRDVIATGKQYAVYAKPFVFPEHPEWGTTYWDWSLQPVFERDGTVGGLVLSLIDVTKREEAVREVAHKNKELATANFELQQFAYIASHDLQEPLRMISSYLQLIERRYNSKLDPDGKEFMAFAVDGAKRLQNMINSLLEYSRIETRGAVPQAVSSTKSLEHALKNLSLVIEENEAVVTYDNLPSVMGDEVQLVQLFQNLIVNAIKFRREVKPEVHIRATPGKGEWIFAVQDNGIGIESQHYDRIFNIFQRLQGHDYPGTGIGLALCKRIVERHGGKIWVESVPSQGAVFYFTLPVDRHFAFDSVEGE